MDANSLHEKIKHNQAQLDRIYPIKAQLEGFRVDIGQYHIDQAISSLYLALAEIVEDSNQCLRLLAENREQGHSQAE